MDLFKLPNVVVVGTGLKVTKGVNTGKYAVIVGVTRKVSLIGLKKSEIIPQYYEGFETDVIETGEIRALRTSRHRPAPGGVSIGHIKVTAGTLGMVVRKNGIRQILSNNHVLANSNDAKIRDFILQPGRADGGITPDDIIAHLTDFSVIHMEKASDCPVAKAIVWGLNGFASLFGRKTRIPQPILLQVNKVDCAIAEPIEDKYVSDEILEVGVPTGLGTVGIGEMVKKSGRTSGLNFGTVIMVDAIAKVNYPTGVATFEDQILTTAIAEPGDSGSVVLTEENKIVGLLFAGSDQVTIMNKIGNVFTALGLDRS